MQRTRRPARSPAAHCWTKPRVPGAVFLHNMEISIFLPSLKSIAKTVISIQFSITPVVAKEARPERCRRGRVPACAGQVTPVLNSVAIYALSASVATLLFQAEAAITQLSPHRSVRERLTHAERITLPPTSNSKSDCVYYCKFCNSLQFR